MGGIAASAGLVVAAAAIGYGIGTGLRYLWHRYQPDERAYRAALAYREARTQFERKYGRPPNKVENAEIAEGFKRALASIRS